MNFPAAFVVIFTCNTSIQGLEAVARMRCSSGLVVERYLGSFHRRTATDIDLPAINADQSIAVQLRHDDKLDKEAFLQFVVLYTTTQGERRIRCVLPLPCAAIASPCMHIAAHICNILSVLHRGVQITFHHSWLISNVTAITANLLLGS